MKRICLILILICAGVLFKACCNEDDDCFTITDINFRSYSTSEELFMNSGDSVLIDDLVFVMESSSEVDLCLNPFDGGGSLYALDCSNTNFIPQQNITRISITCNSPLSNDYPIGAELKELFRIGAIEPCEDNQPELTTCIYPYSYDTQKYPTIEELFSMRILWELYVAETQQWRSHDIVTYIELEEEVIPGWKEFTFDFVFDDGSWLTVRSQNLFIQ